MKLVLFDIDGTILWTDGSGRRAVYRALREVYGAAAPDEHEFDGKTDPQIVRELMRLTGRSGEEVERNLPRAIALYVDGLRTELAAEDHTGKIYPGVLALLDQLEARDDVALGLLTGNVREGAEVKLKAVGIDSARFRVGAFGSDHADRPELPAIAQARGEALLGRPLPGSDVVIIGDTPADIRCGRGIGARAIGVATGRYSVQALEAEDAHRVFADLSAVDEVIHAILAEGSPA